MGETIAMDPSGEGFKKITVDVEKKSTCDMRYGMRFPDDIMCGTGMKGTDTCIRDRGAGAYWTHKGQKYLYAVTNTGTTDCTGRVPRLYSRVIDYLNWIYEVTGGKAGVAESVPKCHDKKFVLPKAATPATNPLRAAQATTAAATTEAPTTTTTTTTRATTKRPYRPPPKKGKKT